MRIQVKKLYSWLGPYPYNPYLIFLFFFALYFSRICPAITEEPRGPARWAAAVVVLALSALPSLVVASGSYLVQRFRRWSASNFLFYILEVALVQSLIFLCNPFLHNILKTQYDFSFTAQAFLTPGLFLGSLLLVLGSLALMHRAERAIEVRLKKADQLVQRLESDREELIQSDEELRRQTSQFLHDRVQSDLMVVAMKLKSIQGQSSGEVDAVISKAIARLENTRSSDLRNLVHILTPNFTSGGFSYVLELLANQYRGSTEVIFDISPSATELPERQQLGLFRIIEQALLNSLVHGPTKKVTVSVKTDQDGRTALSVVDDGPGVDLSLITPGVGSAIIDSWTHILKGKQNVISEPGKGYRLDVVFPL